MVAANTENHQRLRDWWPDLHLTGACRIAVQFSQLSLGTAAVWLLSIGLSFIDTLPYAPLKTTHSLPWDRPFLESTDSDAPLTLLVDAAAGCGEILALPARSVIAPTVELLRAEQSWSDTAYAWTQLIWALLVWAFFGAALARLNAVNFAVEQSISLKSALRFSARNYLAYLTAPFLPAVGVLFFWLLLVAGGWISEIPTVGPYIAGVFWFLALVIAFLIVLIVVAVFAGWPLMYATISTEVSDGFDGFSRPFSYIFSRPWQVVRLYFLSAVYGILCVGVAVALAFATVHLARWGVAGLAVGDSWTTGGAVGLIAFWEDFVAVLIFGFGTSLFWSLATIAYFILRQADDATSLDEVFLEPGDEEDDGFHSILAGDEPLPGERPLEKDPGVRSEDQSGNGDAEKTASDEPAQTPATVQDDAGRESS